MELLTRLGPDRDAPAGSAAVMLLLGDFAFTMKTAPYQRLRRATEYRWPAQARIGRRPAVQHTGPGPERITLDGALYPALTGGRGALRTLRAAAARGEPLTLVDSLGFIYGRWVVLRVEDTLQVLLDNGAPRRIDFRAELAHYGDDA